MTTGRLKIFKSVRSLFDELRLYRRDEKGNVVKENDHLCLHPSTKVITKNGNVPIKDLVGTTGEIIGISGEWEKYRNCWRTGKNKETVRVIFNNGSEVCCTPDHEFLTTEGWIKAFDLTGKDCYANVSQTIKGENLCRSTPYQTQSRSSLAGGIIFVENIFKEMVQDCIGFFGNTIMEKYRMGIMSTIRTAILQIIQSTTLNLNLTQNTYRITRKAIQEVFLQKLLRLLRYGIPEKVVVYGTSYIMMQFPTNYTRKNSLNVSNVARNILERLGVKTDSAQMLVKQKTDIFQELITNTEFAKSAGKYLLRTNTVRRKPVPSCVVSKVASVKKGKKSDVYCMDVPGTHSFAIEHGVIVHNCDDLRYICLSGLQYAIMQPDEDYEEESRFATGRNRITGY